jgi:DNA-binding beta-propeller fold protein YncE
MPTTIEQVGGRRLALVIATAAYGDATLAKLRSPGADAVELAGVLGDAAIGGFEVETVIDGPTEALRRRLAHFCSGLRPSDLALIYMSCHGVLDDRGRLYYATTDTDRTLLSATALPSAWLNEQLEECRSRRQVLVLDCCHSGAFAKGAKGEGALALGKRFEGRGRIVLTGSRGTEYSFEGDQVTGGETASSIFTGALVEGLRSGEADRDGDGVVTVNELYDHAFEAVRESEAQQTPTLWTYGVEGDLLIAQSPRGPVVEPQPAGTVPPPPGDSPRGTPSTRAEPPKGPDSPRGDRRRPIAIAAAALFALGAVVLVIVLLAGSGNERSEGGEINAAGEAPPGKPIPMNGSPRGIAVGEGATWVARFETNVVSRIDPSSRFESIRVGPSPRQVVAGEGSVWVGYDEGGKLARIDPESLEVTKRLDLANICGCTIEHLALGQGKVWVGSLNGEKTITAFDAENGNLAGGPYSPGDEFEGIFAVGDDAVWAIENNGHTSSSSLIRIDLELSERADFQLSSPSYFSGVAYGDGTVWIADSEDGKNLVNAFDSAAGKIVRSIQLESVNSDDIVAAGDSVFVWNGESNLLSEIDASSKKLVKTSSFPEFHRFEEPNHYQSELAVGNGVVWVTNPAENKVFRTAY